jgi:hypothetical protein
MQFAMNFLLNFSFGPPFEISHMILAKKIRNPRLKLKKILKNFFDCRKVVYQIR